MRSPRQPITPLPLPCDLPIASLPQVAAFQIHAGGIVYLTLARGNDFTRVDVVGDVASVTAPNPAAQRGSDAIAAPAPQPRVQPLYQVGTPTEPVHLASTVERRQYAGAGRLLL
ncbi:MAG TPA: hypothetical protein VHB98_14770 [Chloroflexota bacterium]|nr:hypothetical protein [Chloroflexota bacterium]